MAKNAVIIQPNGQYDGKVADIKDGPSYSAPLFVDLETSVDPEARDDEDYDEYSDEEWEAYHDSICGTKIGGTPCYVQFVELPDEDQPWTLLMQIDSMDVPFEINFGDAGVAYAYLNSDATVGKMLWQCY